MKGYAKIKVTQQHRDNLNKAIQPTIDFMKNFNREDCVKYRSWFGLFKTKYYDLPEPATPFVFKFVNRNIYCTTRTFDNLLSLNVLIKHNNEVLLDQGMTRLFNKYCLGE